MNLEICTFCHSYFHSSSQDQHPSCPENHRKKESLLFLQETGYKKANAINYDLFYSQLKMLVMQQSIVESLLLLKNYIYTNHLELTSLFDFNFCLKYRICLYSIYVALIPIYSNNFFCIFNLHLFLVIIAYILEKLFSFFFNCNINCFLFNVISID